MVRSDAVSRRVVAALLVLVMAPGCEKRAAVPVRLAPSSCTWIGGDGPRVVFTGNPGCALSWDCTTGTARRAPTGLDSPWAILSTPGTDKILVCGILRDHPGSGRTPPQQLGFALLTPSLAVTQTFNVPDGPPVACWVTPTKLAVWSRNGPSEQLVTIWGLTSAQAHRLRVIPYPVPVYSLTDMRRINERLVFAHVTIKADSTTESEAAILDIESGVVLKRAQGAVRAIGVRSARVRIERAGRGVVRPQWHRALGSRITETNQAPRSRQRSDPYLLPGAIA